MTNKAYIVANGQQERKNKKAYHSEIENLPNGKRKLHIYVYGYDLTKGQRTLTDRNPDVIKEDHEFFDILLNKKADEMVKKDPNWIIDNLSDWRSWANSYITEFYDKQINKLASDIRKSQEDVLKGDEDE